LNIIKFTSIFNGGPLVRRQVWSLRNAGLVSPQPHLHQTRLLTTTWAPVGMLNLHPIRHHNSCCVSGKEGLPWKKEYLPLRYIRSYSFNRED